MVGNHPVGRVAVSRGEAHGGGGAVSVHETSRGGTGDPHLREGRRHLHLRTQVCARVQEPCTESVVKGVHQRGLGTWEWHWGFYFFVDMLNKYTYRRYFLALFPRHATDTRVRSKG